MDRPTRIANWPARDRELWTNCLEQGSLFGGGGLAASWSEASRFKTSGGYTAWLRWLAAHEQLDAYLEPADRVTQERVAAYVGELQKERSPNTVLCRIRELHDALRAMAPESNCDWLANLSRTLNSRVRPVRDKLSRMKPVDELAALGERLMDEAEATAKWSSRRRAVAYRNGLVIAFLAYRPVRLKNLAMMRLGRHLAKVSGVWRIAFSADETKTRVPYEAVFPSALAPRLERYLDAYRPLLLRGRPRDGNQGKFPLHPDLDAVWVSDTGIQIHQGTLAGQIVRRTKAAFGRSVSPHLFRDAAATSISVDNPRHIGDAGLVLGHADHRTTEKHYIHARSLEASRRHAETLAHLREELKASGHH